MKKVAAGNLKYIAIIFALLVGSCGFFIREHGKSIVVDGQVFVTKPDAKAASGEEIYIVETFGNIQIVTSRIYTKADGSVDLHGKYCSPLIIAAAGGELVIHDSLGPNKRLEIVLKPGSVPNLVQAYGIPTLQVGKYKELRESGHC